ncbi:MAG: proton-conducting transporter transmembrane domain-containing protein [Candidatus Dormibacteria bacterium]
MNLAFLQDFGPIGILVLGAAACSWLDLGQARGDWGRRAPSRWVALAALLLAFLASIGFWHSSFGPNPPDVEHGSFLIDRFALFFYAVGLAAAGAVVLCGADAEVEVAPHTGVYHALLLMATAGVLFTASAADLISLAVGLALTSLPLAIAQGLSKTNLTALRTATRSLTLGGALLLAFIGGEAIVAGLSGTTSLSSIARQSLPVDPLMGLAALLLVVGALGQLGVFPFGGWRALELERTPLAAGTARTVLPALAAMAALLRLLPGALGAMPQDWTVTVSVVAALTLVVAPILALRERRLLRAVQLLVVAQVALCLLDLLDVSKPATASLLYLLLSLVPIAAATLGLWGALRGAGEEDTKVALRGLWARTPWLAGMLALLVAAAAGLPPLAGFFVRIFSVEAALRAGFGWLALVALVSGVVGVLVAYRWVMVIFDARVDGPEIVLPGRVALVGVVLCGVSFLGFVVAMGPLLGIATRAALPPLFGP